MDVWRNPSARNRQWPAAALTASLLACTALAARTVDVPQALVTLPVYGTCADGHCGLKQRRGPGPSFAEAARRLSDGSNVIVVCKLKGARVPRHRSRLWLRTVDDTFVSDAFVDRPRGARPPYIPTCQKDLPA